MPTPFQSPWTNVLRRTGLLPELELWPPFDLITLGTGAFTTGLLIGTALRHAWMHFDGSDLGTTYSVGGNTPPLRIEACTATTGNCFGFLPHGPIWVYEWGTGWSTVYYDQTNAAGHAAYVVLHGLTAGTEVCIAHTSAPGGGTECMYQRYLTKAQAEAALRADQPLQTLTSQPYSYSSGWRNPGGCGDTSTACSYNTGPSNPTPCYLVSGVLQCGGTLSNPLQVPGLPADPTYIDANSNQLRCQIDPSNWACPGVDSDNEWSDTGGPKITMPDCYGLSVTDCESSIDSALAATGSSTTPAFSIATAPTYDSSIPTGYVQATVAAANTISSATSVTLQLNQTSPPKPCQSETDYPHESTTQASRGMMLVKGRVMCPTSQLVDFNVTMWKCTSYPQPDLALLDSGAWGCQVISDQPWSIAVTAFAWSASKYSASSEGPQGGVFYIGATYGADVEESYSQIIDGDDL
jgi:hypothetical protein